MDRRAGWMIAAMVLGVCLSLGKSWAAEGTKPWVLSLELGCEGTDNRDGRDPDVVDQEANLDLFARPRFDFNYLWPRTLLNFFVAPSIKWHSNPRGGDEAQHDWEPFIAGGVNFDHKFSERVRLTLGDTVAYTDDAELGVRRSASHWSEKANAGLEVWVMRRLGFGLSADGGIKRYTDSTTADDEDEDVVNAAADIKYAMGAGFTVLGNGEFSRFANKTTQEDPVTGEDWERGANIFGGGLAIEKLFNPDFKGRVEGGYQHAEYDMSGVDALDTANGKAELTLGSFPLRFTVSAEYGLYPPAVRPYSVQTMAGVLGKVEYAILRERILLGAHGQFTSGEYERESDTISGLQGGRENMGEAGVKAGFRFGRHTSLDVKYNFEVWDSELREDFIRNTVGVAVTGRI